MIHWYRRFFQDHWWIVVKRVNMPKTVVLCQTLQNCSTFFSAVKKIMGKNITDPPGALYNGIVHFRLFDVFTAVSSLQMREILLKEFCTSGSRLWLLISTTALGMGVDCPDIDRMGLSTHPRGTCPRNWKRWKKWMCSGSSIISNTIWGKSNTGNERLHRQYAHMYAHMQKKKSFKTFFYLMMRRKMLQE